GEFYELSRVTSDNYQLKLKPLNVSRLLREACLDQYKLFEKEHLLLQLEISEDAPALPGDADALNRIFSNLLQNSIRYGKSRLLVSLEASSPEKTIRIRFSNDIRPEQRLSDPSLLFDRFYMQEQSRTHGGTGLGLTIAATLTQLMNGKIEAAYSEENAAELLTITLVFPGFCSRII
ncbi:MAG: ATP-binding protein, partial [Lachnospiraceae bacterium]|nr:ATP-binding protein [Lachnospiraceae bacterium]